MKYVIKDNCDFVLKLIQLEYDKKFKKKLSLILYEKYYNDVIEKWSPFNMGKKIQIIYKKRDF